MITLAAASEEVLGNYLDGAWVKDNEESMFSRMYLDAVSRGLEFKNRQEFSQKLINVTKNSLKHAGAQEEQHVSINQEEMVIRIMLALMNFQIGARRPFSEPMSRFEVWLKANRAHYLQSNAV